MAHEEALKIAYYVTGHGLGHATRVLEVCKALLSRGHAVTICTAAPHAFFQRQLPGDGYAMRSCLLDSGAFQLDAFTVDMKRSLEEYQRVAADDRPAKLAQEAAWLQSQAIDLVVSDVVPLACAAAAAAGVPAACVSNFSWDFVYSEYLTSVGSGFRRLVWQIAEDYARAELLLRLPGHCPMPAFREVLDVPLVVRRARRPPAEVRADLGVPEGARLMVFMYGGQPPGDWQLRAESLPPGWLCAVCSGGKLPGGRQLPPNFLLAPADVYTPDLIAAASCVLGKIGYGSVSECLAHGRPLVFVRRDHFMEEPFLRKVLELHSLAVEIQRRDFLQGNWRAFIQQATELVSTFRDPTNGAEVVAELLEDLAHEKRRPRGGGSDGGRLSRANSLALARQQSAWGSTRLRDAVVFGYIMHRHTRREKVEVPEWYTSGQLPNAAAGAPPSPAPSPQRQPSEPLDFTLLEGSPAVLAECEDTRAFLSLLAGLQQQQQPGPGELPERRAARGLFRSDADVWVCRAPGRLDVMGGIADYSGSLVLQLPTAEACHVAAQAHPPGAQPGLWQHIRERQRASGRAGPVVRIVSLNADNTNRGHAFDIDLADLRPGGVPLPYAEAAALFKADHSISWAAYVAGALLVLMHETGAALDHGLSLLVSSEVPDGKGVSSSAALEVAAMSAIAAAHGLRLPPARLAALCQKVENCVVGAPCGIMDQMASVLGEKDRLLALRCQPAEVLPAVRIPPGLRLWGVDSGLRHSVGGQDYGSVRAAAFMGLKIVSALAAAGAAGRLRDDGGLEGPPEQQPPPIGGGYLANLEAGDFQLRWEEQLPARMAGAAFLQQYGAHWDAATAVQPAADYPVRQATAHPVLENARVEAFEAALTSASSRQAGVLGSLMYQSHASYSRCGLGSKATDRLVALVRAEAAAAAAQGRPPALFGAKITGGGSGGTVCILGRDDSSGEAALARVVAAYSRETGGFAPKVFAGSSLGAAAFGRLRVRLGAASSGA